MMLCMLRAVSDKKITQKYIYIYRQRAKDLKSSWIDATILGGGTNFGETETALSNVFRTF